ncbi:heterokaryon incompatibility protein-domain-containing protein [Leptodontidium sp. MPI-SDFR-AT-0119]|nr:heterokaryon incompatibility protein-domain-containing protein [Leptodontidium sp. MPI-SDFR-AT-0119]
MSYFEYRPLTPHKARIRLLDVLPETHHQSVESPLDQHHGDRALSESSNPVSCTLSHVSLEAAPAYTALSYNWGDTAQRVGILVNGATIMVTLNLEAALRHLRLPDKPLTLWVDFLCIDQSDKVEKSEQLEQMRQIYVQALSVVAWLGPAESNSDAALHWIQQYGGRSLDLGIGTKPELRLRYLLEALEANGKGLVDARLKKFAEDLKEGLSPTNLENADIITALSRLFKRPYWSRIWIIQELSSASRLIFMCGNRMVKDDHLNHAVRLLRNFGHYQHLQRTHDSPIAHSPGVSVNSIDTHDPISLIKLRRAAVPSPLIHLMRSFRHFQATDPRDKVFALLGISKDTEALRLHPDYRKSCQEVYSNLARTLIRNGYVEVLSLCEFPKQIDGLPSWVHDWSAKSYRSPLQQRSLDRRARPITSILEPKFSASGTNQTISLEGGHTTSWRMPLLLRATFLGEVQQVGMSWERNAFGRWLHDLQKLSSLIPDTSILSGGGAHAVWRTAVADQEIRQGIGKPRLSEEKVRIVHELLKGVDMSLMDAQKFLRAGLSDYCEQLRVVAQGRRPLLASGNYLGIGPRETEQGDLVFILLGADTPYILRRRSQDETLHLIGEAYMYGVMDGEAMEGSPVIEEIAIG